MEKEFIVFIHGITPKSECKSHLIEYNELYNGVKKYITSSSPWNDAQKIPTEWGWDFDNKPNPANHKLLNKAQDLLAKRVIKEVNDTRDFTVNPMRCALKHLREMMLYGFSDMFYYVSTEGKVAIRRSISEQIAREIIPHLKGDGTRVSLTLIGHSAGSVIAIDLSYYLFSRKQYYFVDDNSSDETRKVLAKMKKLAEQKNIRLRRLITIGSPISLLACRKDVVVELLADGKKINPELHGMVENDKD